MVLLAWQRHFLDGPLKGISVEQSLSCGEAAAQQIVALGATTYRSLSGGLVRDDAHRICPMVADRLGEPPRAMPASTLGGPT